MRALGDVHPIRATGQVGRETPDCLLTLDVVDELNSWRAECGDVHLDRFVFATASGKPRNKDNVRTILGRVVDRVNEDRERRRVISLPPVTPHTLRRTYISLMLEAGAPLHYVMGQVGHEDSKTTLEIYAHVQNRINRTQVKRSFEALLAASAKDDSAVPAEPCPKLPRKPVRTRKAVQRGTRRAEEPLGPRKWSTEAKNNPRG